MLLPTTPKINIFVSLSIQSPLELHRIVNPMTDELIKGAEDNELMVFSPSKYVWLMGDFRHPKDFVYTKPKDYFKVESDVRLTYDQVVKEAHKVYLRSGGDLSFEDFCKESMERGIIENSWDGSLTFKEKPYGPGFDHNCDMSPDIVGFISPYDQPKGSITIATMEMVGEIGDLSERKEASRLLREVAERDYDIYYSSDEEEELL